MYTVEYHSNCKDDLERLGPVVADRLLKSIEQKIMNDAKHAGVSLAGGVPNGRMVSVLSTHIIFQVDEKKKKVLVLGVRPEGTGVA